LPPPTDMDLRTSSPTPTRRVRRRRAALALVVVVAALIGGIFAGLSHASPRRLTDAGGHAGGTPLDARAFAAGACVAFAPTAGNRHDTVFLDAGHGGVDPGALGVTDNGSTIQEADETLPVELDAMAILRAEGFRVVVSRTTGTTVARLGPRDVSGGVPTLQGAHDDVAARDACADDAGARALVGVYFDGGPSPQNAGSLTAYDGARPFAAANLALANLLQQDVLAAMNAQGWAIPDDGVQLDTHLGSYVGDPDAGGIAGDAASYDHLLLIGPAMAGFFAEPSTMPGAVIEPLYITDPFEGTMASTSHGQAVIGRGIARAVMQFLAPAPGRHPASP